MRILLTQATLTIVAAVLLTYVTDIVQLHLRGSYDLDIITVQRFYVVDHKDGRTEFLYLSQEDQQCSRS